MRSLAAPMLAVLVGCTATVRGSALSSRPMGGEIFLSTGAAPRPYQTLGFVQVTGFGNEVAGVIELGEAGLDSTIRGSLADAAVRMGGDGVIHIEFLDENPRTPAERASDLASQVQSLAAGKTEIRTRWRSVRASGEVIRFLR